MDERRECRFRPIFYYKISRTKLAKNLTCSRFDQSYGYLYYIIWLQVMVGTFF